LFIGISVLGASLPHTFSLGQAQCSISLLCCLCVMMVHCLFSVLQGSLALGAALAQEMSFVIYYLPCFWE
jgi:hypothetical protein